MQCRTSKLTWPIFVYFRPHYTLCKGSAPQAQSRDGEAATNPVPCSKQHSALVFSTKSSTPITKMGRKHQDKPSHRGRKHETTPHSHLLALPDFLVKAVMNSFMCRVAFLKNVCFLGFFFYLFDLLFKAPLCTNFGRRSRGVSLELSEYSREKSKTAPCTFLLFQSMCKCTVTFSRL